MKALRIRNTRDQDMFLACKNHYSANNNPTQQEIVHTFRCIVSWHSGVAVEQINDRDLVQIVMADLWPYVTKHVSEHRLNDFWQELAGTGFLPMTEYTPLESLLVSVHNLVNLIQVWEAASKGKPAKVMVVMGEADGDLFRYCLNTHETTLRTATHRLEREKATLEMEESRETV